MYSTCEPLVWIYICSETCTALWAENLHYMQRVLLKVCCVSYTQNIVSCNLWHRHAFMVHTACDLCSVHQNFQFTALFQQSTAGLRRSSINVGAKRQVSDTNQVLHSGPTIVSPHRTKFSRPGHLARCIYVPLVSALRVGQVFDGISHSFIAAS